MMRTSRYASTVWLLCSCGWICTGTLARTFKLSEGVLDGRVHWRVTNLPRGGGGATGTQQSTMPRNPLFTKFVPSIQKPNNNAQTHSSTQTPSSANTFKPKKDSTIDTAKEQIDAFLTRDSRNGFIARVYAILAVQLLVTTGSICLFGTHPEWAEFFIRQCTALRFVPVIVPYVIGLCTWMSMSESVPERQLSPNKWRNLALYTLSMSVMVGFVSSLFEWKSVVSAMIVTALATIGVSLYTVFQSNAKFDLSLWGSSLSSFLLILLFYELSYILELIGILPRDFIPYNEKLCGLVGATLFSCYLAYHTKLIIGGKHSKYQMNEKDYVFGAMALYNDIINIFLRVLQVVGEDRKRGKK